MRVTLFGAAFDPPHLGHEQIAVSLLERKLTNAVWLVPVKEHPFGKRLAPPADRLAMTRLLGESISKKIAAMGNQPHHSEVKVETYELYEPGVSYTLRTLNALSDRYPAHQFSFVIGTDNLATFHKWDQYQVLLAKYPVFVYPRHGFSFQPIYQGMKPMKNMQEVRISSTIVREQVNFGMAIKTLVPAEVANYIEAHQLYK